MRKTILFAAAVSVMAAPSMAIAASKGKKDAAPAPAAQPAAPGTSQEDIQRGVIVIRSFAGALNSDQLNNEQKGAIVACLYNNPVRQISVATGKVLAENTNLDPKNPNHVYAAAAAVCAVPKGEANAASAPTKPAPQKGR
ncbi:hypothetical protein [Caenibius sp. WL]|uniref:hypothetical protein n=1 Tax=Caenibius sp. WL TaxID=2872646 RepID=UPI001C99B229|nr:hypothetical protein [Caenibius sp. WL]QZP07250.1 hypothetical protein K5X80_11160 [Caenibius sp. WL]